MLQPALGNAPGSGTFGVVLVLYSLVIEFLVIYRWTRTDFRQELERHGESSLART